MNAPATRTRRNNNRAASVAALIQIKDVTREDARRIRAVWRADGTDAAHAAAGPVASARVDSLHSRDYRAPSARRVKRELIDAILQAHGVEYLGIARSNGASVYYCNAGDTYSTTVIFRGGVLSVGCYGDLIERDAVDTGPQY